MSRQRRLARVKCSSIEAEELSGVEQIYVLVYEIMDFFRGIFEGRES